MGVISDIRQSGLGTPLLMLLVIPLLLLLIACKELYGKRKKNLLHLPGPFPLPFVGNALKFIGPTEDFVHKMTYLVNKYGSVFRLHLGPRANLIISEPEAFEKILSSNKHITKGKDYVFLWDWLGFGLLTSTGAKWHSRRKMLTPAFHFRILEDFLDIMNNQCDILCQKLTERVDKSEFDIFPYITHCALDIICETAMGKCINAQENDDTDYVKAVFRSSEIVFQRQRSPWLWYDKLFHLTPMGAEWRHAVKIMHNFTNEVIRERKVYQENLENETNEDDDVGIKKRFAFLDLLIKQSQGGTVLSDEDIREEVDTFMFEGHDTTAANMSFTMYMMALHPSYQKRVQEELDEVFQGSDRMATSDDLNKLKFMEACLKESLRLYQSVPVMSRTTGEDMELNGYIIPKGTNVILVNFFLHRDQRTFNDPNTFNPERFTSKNTETRHPYSYIPFSAGPRNCIGQKFAMLEEKVLVSSVLRNFNLKTTVPLEELKLLPEVVLKPFNGIRVSITKRDS